MVSSTSPATSALTLQILKALPQGEQALQEASTAFTHRLGKQDTLHRLERVE